MIKNTKIVLVTAAKNEEDYIEYPLESILKQTIVPVKWIIVSDGSTDNTDNIIQKYASKYKFIQLLRLDRNNNRNFGAQANAIRRGVEELKNIDYDFIGNIDADISFNSDYFEKLLLKFNDNQKLGLAGGTIQEKYNGIFVDRKTNNLRSVPNAIQLFRKKCFEDIKGYKILKYGGHDVLAEYESRMNGWDVSSFSELKVYHHRYTNTGGGSILKQYWRIGKMDYSLGSQGAFELFKCISRFGVKPYLIGSITRYTGYIWSSIIREKRTISDDLIKFTKKEQLKRLKFFNYDC